MFVNLSIRSWRKIDIPLIDSAKGRTDAIREIPRHSTKNRHGHFQEWKLFEQLFERIASQCVEVGPVQGRDLSVDGGFAEANAAKESRIPRKHQNL
jgi:transposase